MMKLARKNLEPLVPLVLSYLGAHPTEENEGSAQVSLVEGWSKLNGWLNQSLEELGWFCLYDMRAEHRGFRTNRFLLNERAGVQVYFGTSMEELCATDECRLVDKPFIPNWQKGTFRFWSSSASHRFMRVHIYTGFSGRDYPQWLDSVLVSLAATSMLKVKPDEMLQAGQQTQGNPSEIDKANYSSLRNYIKDSDSKLASPEIIGLL